MHRLDITVIIYLSRSLFLSGGEEVLTFRFKSKVMQITLQKINDRVNVNGKP